MDSHDNSSTCVMQMYQLQFGTTKWQQTQVSSATMMWGYGNLDFCNAKMPCLQGIEGMQMSVSKESFGDKELEFPIISNVSQRAMLSNTMSAIHTCKKSIPHRERNRSFGEHKRVSD